MPPRSYPEWFYYPSHMPPPPWVDAFVGVVAAARPAIESRVVNALKATLSLRSFGRY